MLLVLQNSQRKSAKEPSNLKEGENMNRNKVSKRFLAKTFLHTFIVCDFVLHYFFIISVIWLLYGPAVAIAILVLTFTLCIHVTVKIYNELSSIL
jgi:hypothetical protein